MLTAFERHVLGSQADGLLELRLEHAIIEADVGFHEAFESGAIQTNEDWLEADLPGQLLKLELCKLQAE